MSKHRSTLLPKTATMSNEFCVEISSFRQSRRLLRQCCPKRQHCRSGRQQSCLLLRQCCFDIVASVDWALRCVITDSWMICSLSWSYLPRPRQGCEIWRSTYLYVCLFVRYFVCLSARMFQKPYYKISRTFLYMLLLIVARSSSDDKSTMQFAVGL